MSIPFSIFTIFVLTFSRHASSVALRRKKIQSSKSLQQVIFRDVLFDIPRVFFTPAGNIPRIASLLALIFITTLSADADAIFEVSSDRGLGATKEQACTNAVNANPNTCKGTDRVVDSTCYFWAEGYYVSCDNLPCTGFNCTAGRWKISGTTCTAPEVFDPLTAQCKLVIPAKNEPPLLPTCGSGSGVAGAGADGGKGTDNPVNLTTGNKHFLETDYVSPGNQNLRFGRAWNSYNQQWLFSYLQYARIIANGGDGFIHSIWIYRNNGRVVSFYRAKNGPWRSDADIRDTIVADGSGWIYTHSSGQKEWFDSKGKLIRVEYVNGNAVDVSHSTNTVTVSDEYGNDLTLTLDAQGRVTAMLDPDGQEYRYFYKASDGNLEHVSYPDGTRDAGSNPFGEDNPYRTYVYGDGNPTDTNLIVEVIDENRETYKTVAYDTEGRAIFSALSNGSVGDSTFDYSLISDADPRVTVTNSLGKDTVYRLENHFGVRTIKQVDGIPLGTCLEDTRSKTYYATNGWLEYEYDKAGVATHYTYYEDTARYGLIDTRIEAEGTADERTFKYDWDLTTRQMTLSKLSIKAGGIPVDKRKTVWVYDTNRRLLSRTETDLTTDAVPYATTGRTRIWNYTHEYYDPAEKTQLKKTMVDGPRTNVTDTTIYEYSTDGFLTKMTNELGHDTVYTLHNGRGQPGKITDPNDTVTLLTYTPRGWLDKVIQDDGGENALTDLDYDDVGQLKKVTLADQTWLIFDYDAAHRLRGIENKLGERIEYLLDDAGNPSKQLVKSDSGSVERTIDFVFDALSRLHEINGSYGQSTEYLYGSDGNLSSISDALNRTTIPTFDDLGRLEAITDPDTEVGSVDYDADNNVTQVTDQRFLVTDYLLDGFGNLKRLISPDTGTANYEFDEVGNIKKITDARGVVVDYAYDALNRLQSIVYPDSSRNITYGYGDWFGCDTCKGRLSFIIDSGGIMLYAYDRLGYVRDRYNIVTLPGGAVAPQIVTHFDHNKAGRLEGMTYPGGQVVTFDLDDAGQVAGVIRQADATADTEQVASTVLHEPFGPVKEITYGSGIQMSREYDDDGRLSTQTVGNKQNLVYERTAMTNTIWKINNQIDTTRNEVFLYDNLDRLDSATGIYGQIRYKYDAVGNRKQRTVTRDAITTTEDYNYFPTNNRLEKIDIQEGANPPEQRTFVYDANGNLDLETRADGSKRDPHYDDTNRMDAVAP